MIELRTKLVNVAKRAEDAQQTGPPAISQWIEKQRAALEETLRLHENNMVALGWLPTGQQFGDVVYVVTRSACCGPGRRSRRRRGCRAGRAPPAARVRRGAAEMTHVGQRLLEIGDAPGRFDALEAEVGCSALALIASLICSASFIRASARTLPAVRGGRRRSARVGDEAAVQAAPLARDVVQVVALLPALQAVRFGGVRLGRAGHVLARERCEDVGIRREPARQVILELHARQRVAGGQLRIGGDRRAPRRDQGRGRARKCASSVRRRAANASFGTGWFTPCSSSRPLCSGAARSSRRRTLGAGTSELRAEQRREPLEQLFLQRPRLPLGQRDPPRLRQVGVEDRHLLGRELARRRC